VQGGLVDGRVDLIRAERDDRGALSEYVERMDEAVQAHGAGTGKAQLDDLRGREVLAEPPVDLVIDGVVIGREEIEELDGQPLLLVEVAPARSDEAGHVLVGDGVVLPRLHAGLALAQLGAPDPQQLEDPATEQGSLTHDLARRVGHQNLLRLVRKDLERDGRRIQALLDPLFDDPARLWRHLVQRNRLDPGHVTPRPPRVSTRDSRMTRLSHNNVTSPSMPIDPGSILLTDRVAVVTGGGSGIGRGIARNFAAFGAKVAVWERTEDTAIAAGAEVGGLGLHVDVRESVQVDAALERTVTELGPVSILVNNAGGVFNSPLLETSENGWDALYRSNLKHVILCTQRVARQMVERSLTGSIMSVTSIEGVRAAPGYAAYAAAKAGVIEYTKTAALELAPHGIRVNALAPDITWTEGLASVAPNPEGMQERFGQTVPMGRAGHVDEMAGAAIFLASSLSSYITGQTIHVDGGTQAASGWYHHPRTGEYVLGPT
jgi:3-oxoacyl-[acyl-carrier protein] reductase